MKVGWTGLESAGKSLLMARHARELAFRNRRWLNRQRELGIPMYPRTMAFDTPMSDSFVAMIRSFGLEYLHFYNLEDIMYLREADIFINEINKFFPQRGSDPMKREEAEFLSQAAKSGVDIYFCSQDFSQTHKQFRFLVNKMYHVVSIFSNRRPTLSSPPVNYIYGLVLYWSVKPSTFKGDNFSMQSSGFLKLPNIYWILRKDTQLYDTLYRVRGSALTPIKMFPQPYLYYNDKGDLVREDVRFARR